MEHDLNSLAFPNLTERLRDLHARMVDVAPDIDRVACALYDASEDMLKTFINSTRDGVALRAHEYRLSDSQSLSHLARTNELRLLENIQDKLAPTTKHSAYVLKEGYQSSLTIPLTNAGEFLGFIFFDSRRNGTFTPPVVRELLLHASVVAMAIAQEVLAVRSIVGTVLFARDLTKLRDMGVWVVGLDMGGSTELFDLAVADQPVCLVMGAEGKGLSRLVRERCDAIASIPLLGELASLNVSAAGVLACYEVTRRRLAGRVTVEFDSDGFE